jgi:hypothetical protein
MTQLRMDDNDDVEYKNNSFSLTENNSDEEIRQRLLQALRLFFNEWFLDKTIGIPYFEAVFVKGTPAYIIEAIFKDTILSVQGVMILSRFERVDFDAGTRIAKLSFDVITVNGDTITIEFSEDVP